MAERRHTCISNRETPEEEQQERERTPQVFEEPPPPTDAAGRTGEDAPAEADDRQTSQKTGSHSLAQKAERARYLDGSMPQTRKKPGAFGEERPDDVVPGSESGRPDGADDTEDDAAR